MSEMLVFLIECISFQLQGHECLEKYALNSKWLNKYNLKLNGMNVLVQKFRKGNGQLLESLCTGLLTISYTNRKCNQY